MHLYIKTRNEYIVTHNKTPYYAQHQSFDSVHSFKVLQKNKNNDNRSVTSIFRPACTSICDPSTHISNC
jgi:hypothetical protein